MVIRFIALLFHDRGTRRDCVVRSTPRALVTPGKDPVPILQEAGWAPEPVWTGGKFRPHRDWILDRSARSQSLYRLSYRAHIILPSKPSYFKWALSFRFPHHKSACISLLPEGLFAAWPVIHLNLLDSFILTVSDEQHKS